MDRILEIAKRLKAIASNGLVYVSNEYDRERYEELDLLARELMSEAVKKPLTDISASFICENDYVTPKVDIRAVIFDRRGRILMVQESSDKKWALPGGWADIGYSPTETAIKEVKEETGLIAKPIRVLAILDKRLHSHPPALHYAYKIFILCAIVEEGYPELTESGNISPFYGSGKTEPLPARGEPDKSCNLEALGSIPVEQSGTNERTNGCNLSELRQSPSNYHREEKVPDDFAFSPSFDILDVGFFAEDSLPPLSEERNTYEQLQAMFKFYYTPDAPCLID